MPQIFGTTKPATRLMMISLGFLAFATIAHADVSPAPVVRGNSQNTAEVKRLVAAATQALKNGNISLATIELKNALRLDPDNGTLHMWLGVALLQDKQAVAAEHELRLARSDGANNQDVGPPLLQSMLGNREWTDLLDQFPNPDPSDKSNLAASILSARALAYQFLGDASDAVSSMDRSLSIRRDTAGLLARVRIAMLQSNYSDAMTYVNQLLALSPNDPDASIEKAEILRFSDKKAALALIESVIKAHPNAMTAVMTRIGMLIEQGQYDEAQHSLDAVLAGTPNLPLASYYRAVLLGVRNKPLDGWRIAQSLPAEFIQSDASIAIGTAQLASESGNLETANSILTTYVDQHPAISEPRLQLAALHLKMNNPSEALNDLAPLMDSKDPKVLQFIAATYQKLNRQSDSLTYLRKAEAAGSKDGGLKYALGLADLQKGQTPQGVQEMLDGIKTQPGNLNVPAAGIDLLLKQSKFVEAQALADQAEKTNPKSPAPPLFKGEILLAQGKKDESLAALDQSLQRDPHYLPTLDAKSHFFMAENKVADATKIWDQVEVWQPSSPLPYVKLAEIAARSQQVPQSIALLKQAISKDPKLIDNRLILAKYQTSQKQYADAEATLKTALQAFPSNPQALAQLAQVQQQSGQKAAALGTNKLLAESYQKSGGAQALLANALLQGGDNKGALAAYKRAIELSPDVLEYRTSLIDLQIRSGDKEGALATARDWGNNHKGPDAALLLAETLAQLKRLPEAASVIAASQNSQPDSRLTILDSQIAMQGGNRSQAISIYKNWLADHASDLPVRLAYASTLLSINDNAGALAQYEIILKSRGDLATVLNNVAYLVKDSDPNRALDLVSKAAQLQPFSPDINDTEGMILLKKGDAKGALAFLQKAHTFEPGRGEISYHLALALNSVGRKADARQVIQAALAKGDNFAGAEDAKKLLQKL